MPVSGKYFISVNLRWENTQAATAYWSAQVYVNGGIPSYTIGNLTPVAANVYSFSNWSGVISLSAGDYVQAGVRSANGGNFTTVQSECSFSGFLLG